MQLIAIRIRRSFSTKKTFMAVSHRERSFHKIVDIFILDV